MASFSIPVDFTATAPTYMWQKVSQAGIKNWSLWTASPTGLKHPEEYASMISPRTARAMGRLRRRRFAVLYVCSAGRHHQCLVNFGVDYFSTNGERTKGVGRQGVDAEGSTGYQDEASRLHRPSKSVADCRRLTS